MFFLSKNAFEIKKIAKLIVFLFKSLHGFNIKMSNHIEKTLNIF
jgi:hypothetical protein